MPYPPPQRDRPHAGENVRAKTSSAADSTSVPRTIDTLADLDAEAARVNGAFVVVVERTGPGCGYRRRPYLTAKAAENAARRAVERGENVRVYLAELKPLWRVVGGGAA